MATAERHVGVRGTPAGMLAVLAAVVGWGWTNTIVAFSPLQAIPFAFWRLWLGTLGMFLVLAALRRRMTWSMLRSSAPGGLLLGAEIIFFFLALKRTSVVDVTIIASLQPALTLIVAGPLFGEAVSRREVGWTAVSLAGVVLATVGSSGLPSWSLAGDLAAFGSLLAWTVYFLVSKRVRSRVPALEYMTAVSLVAAVAVTPVALLSGQRLGPPLPAEVAWILVFVVGATGGHILVAWAHPHVDVSVSSLLMLAQPVVAAVSGFVVLGQRLAPLEAIGGAIVIGAVAAIVRHAARAGGGEALASPEVPPG